LFKDGIKAGFGLVAAAVVAAVVIIAVMCIGIFGFGWFQRSTADFRGETAQIERVKADPNYRIAAYEHFYDLCAAVKKDEARIISLNEELTTDPPSARVTQINASLTTIRLSRDSKIEQYNADARKEDTQANFLASDLPFELDPNRTETSCYAS
jgi:uncharacterized membrane protein YhiD involved in acid resistance